MPFIVTTKLPGETVGQAGPGQALIAERTITRRAVATLDEVPCDCGKPHLGGTEHADECPVGIQLVNPILRGAPFTVGPLPDGTTIEVEAVKHFGDLWEMLPFGVRLVVDSLDRDGIIAAFNAKQAPAHAL